MSKLTLIGLSTLPTGFLLIVACGFASHHPTESVAHWAPNEHSRARDTVPTEMETGTTASLKIDTMQSGSVHAPPLKTPGPLSVLALNPRYFTDGTGKAVYLTGSHTWSSLLDRGTITPPPSFPYTDYIDFMVANKFNFMRLWTAGMTNVGSADPDMNIVSGPLPWARIGPGIANDGKPKFDLDQFDQAYFDRVRERAIQAGKNGIYVAIQLFDGYNLQFGDSANDGNPLGGANNINGIDCAKTCSQNALTMLPEVWAYEQAYIRKLIDSVNDLDNVLYEVANEAGAPYSTAWQYKVINYVKAYEATKLKQHPIGMTWQYRGGGDATLYNSPADWISTGAIIPSGIGAKVIINDTDHSYVWLKMKRDGQASQRAWVWKNMMRGNNPAFMDPYLVKWAGRNDPGGTTEDPRVGTTLDGYWDVIRNAMRDTAIYSAKIDLPHMTPQGSLTSTGYALASPGSEYLIYQPGSGTFTVNMIANTYIYEWFDAEKGAIAARGIITTSHGSQSFTPPLNGDSVLYLKAQPPE